MLSVAYVTSVQGWLNDQMFEVTSPGNVNDVAIRWAALQPYLQDRGVELHTYDKFGSMREVDLWLIEDPTPRKLRFVLRRGINPRNIVIYLVEPPVVNPWGWRILKYYRHFVRTVLTWHSGFMGRYRNFYHWNFPVPVNPEVYPHYRSNEKVNLALMMHSNKFNRQPGELYSLRRRILRYFERRGDGLLHLYGWGWNDSSSRQPFFTPLYQGTTPDKRETYSRYRFSFCIDNSIVPGYITYDPFISMSTGTVPIYSPMPDSLNQIPADTFIDINKFHSLDELVQYLETVASSEEFDAYRDRGWEFLISERFSPFTIERFCEDMYRGITGGAT